MFLLILLSAAMFLKIIATTLFEEFALISNGLGIKQVVREALTINNNICLERDLGEYSLIGRNTNLITNDLRKNLKKQ